MKPFIAVLSLAVYHRDLQGYEADMIDTQLLGLGTSPGKPYFMLGGFADEAADSIEDQVAATKDLGWKYIEARSVNGINIHDISDREFMHMQRILEKNDIRVSCFGSTIANWGSSVLEDFSETMKTVKRAIERMKCLDVKLIRIMSYAVLIDAEGNPLPDQCATLRFEHLRAICEEFLAQDMIPVHENCFNYGGMSISHTQELLAAVPSLKLVFDTGNPCLTQDYDKPAPRPYQDAWSTWLALKTNVVHLHVKDGWHDKTTDKEIYTYPGEGPCHVRDILEDCKHSDYGGFLSIEPHMAVVFHNSSVRNSDEMRRSVYREYGKRLEKMLWSIGFEIREGVAYGAMHEPKNRLSQAR